MKRQEGSQLHERQVAELLLVSGYGPLALLHHSLDRLADTWMCLTNFLDLQFARFKSSQSPTTQEEGVMNAL